MESQSNNLVVFMKRPDVLTKFTDILGDNGKSYVQSVLIAVSASAELMKCTPESIFRSALRAASLGLSCDPALKQAWLVPYNRKQGDGWIKEAQFQPHYKGLYTLAMRTGKYWNINVSAIYDGQRVMENPLTGMHAVMEENGFMGEHPGKNPAYMDVTIRRRDASKIIGWLGYFKTKKGFEKSIWMSSAEIDDHARKYVKDYDKNPNWNDGEKRLVMEMKTVLRQLLSWADMSGTESALLVEAMKAEEGEPIDAVIENEPNRFDEDGTITYERAKQVVIKTTSGKEKFLGELDAESLNKVYLSSQTTDEQKEAAVIVLKSDFNMDPPAVEKKTEKQNMTELGF